MDDQKPRQPRLPESGTGARNLARPLFLIALVVLAFACRERRVSLFVIGGLLLSLTALIWLVFETGRRRKLESERGIRCG
jgi:hypothetical protein